jgi:hypothetical protein
LAEPALDACGEYRELANWPISPKTDYYNLAGKDFTGTCRRAAELADEEAKEEVGRRFLEEMAVSTSTKSPLPARAPAQDEEQKGEEYRRRSEEQAQKPENDQEQEDGRRQEGERRRGGRNAEPDRSEPVERVAGEDLRDVDLEEIGREVLKLIRSYTGQSRTPRGESEAHNEKEED